jgi:spore coat polysaccharide biosynthesis protein SpsF (cytidylyltransferase family)
MKAVVVVQARLGSIRLPGKVMRRLGEVTVLAHVLTRCRAIPGADMVCCAIPGSLENDPVAVEAARCGVEVFRGSEEDVLARYEGAARQASAEVVMRVTSDCPMIDPVVCGEVLKLLASAKVDYACNNMPPSWPHGLDCEAMHYEWLARAGDEATSKAEREHVTPFIRNHPEARKANLEGPGGVDHRWTLDNASDWDFLEQIWRRLPEGEAGWDYRWRWRSLRPIRN